MAIEQIITYKESATNLQLIYSTGTGTFSIISNPGGVANGSIVGLAITDMKDIRRFVNAIDAILNLVP